MLENDSGQKLLRRWIIQTLSFRVRGGGLVSFFPLKSLGRDNELCEQFQQVNRQLPGKHSPSLCAMVMWEMKRQERKVDIS